MSFRSAKPSFWITNLTNKAICITELDHARVQPYQSINLLDTKHYRLTLEQLVKSENSGELFRRKQELVHRKVAPREHVPIKLEMVATPDFPNKPRSAVVFEEIHFDELDISDDKFAEEAADLTDK